MSVSNRLPIYLTENSPGGELPSERRYSYSSIKRPIGFVILPEGMTYDLFADYIRLERHPQGKVDIVASLVPWRIVQAAVNGEFGLKWENNPGFHFQ